MSGLFSGTGLEIRSRPSRSVPSSPETWRIVSLSAILKRSLSRLVPPRATEFGSKLGSKHSLDVPTKRSCEHGYGPISANGAKLAHFNTLAVGREPAHSQKALGLLRLSFATCKPSACKPKVGVRISHPAPQKPRKDGKLGAIHRPATAFPLERAYGAANEARR